MSRWQRLSGYLLTKPTGPFKRLKGSQRQWYEFDEASMTIRVFRTEEEANTVNKEPLRVINVLNAVFNIDPSELNQFVITSDDKEHVLQAETEEAMHLWLHTLKSRRNEAINSDPTTLLSYDTTLSMERKKPMRNSVTKIPPNLMKPASETTYDLSEFQCSLPLNTAVDWRARRTFSSTSSSNTSQGHSYTPTTPPKTHVDAQETFVTMRQTSIPEEQLSECRPSSNQTADSTMDLVSDNIDALRYRQVVDEDEEDGTQPQTLIVSTTYPVPDTLKHFWNISSNGRTQLDRQHLKSANSINNHGTSITGGDSPVSLESRQQPDEPNYLPNAKDDVLKPSRKEEGYVEDSTVVATIESTGNEMETAPIFPFEPELPLVDHKSSDLFDFGGFTTVQSMDSLFGRLSGTNVTPNTVRVLRNELEDYHERVSWLQKTLSLREAALAELDQRIRMQDDADDKPYSLSIPPGASNTTLRNMLHEMEQKQRILHSRMRFLVGEIRDLSAVRQMLTDHGAKQVRYTRKLTTEVFEWKQEYVKLLECCLGAFHLDATHGLMFSDYGKKRCKAKLAALLEESRRKDPSLPSLNKPSLDECHVDTYGFKQPYSSETALMHYVCKNLHIFLSRQLAGDDQLLQHWNELMRQPKTDMSRTELKELCRAGIPSVYRSGIWRMLVRGELKATILEKGPHYYNRLIAEISESKVATKYRKQISLDLLRTMPNNVHFDSLESPGIQKLQEVLQAYSIHNPEIGYCQGMNFLVAVALLVLHKEDAFWCLTAILEKYLPSKYFNCGLISAQVDQLVLKDLLASKLPKLAEHINRMEIDISAITLNWFLVLFYDCVPFETLIRIWDVFLLEGPKSLFRFALALLKRSEEILLLQADTISFWKCLKSVARLTYDADSLMKTAYEEFQPFVSRSTIASLRNQHYEILSKEMNEKKSVWQSVHKEVAEELLDEINGIAKNVVHRQAGRHLIPWKPEEIARRRISKVDRPCIHAATSYNERFVWICHGDKFNSHVTEVQVAENRMIQLDMHLDTRVTCAAALHENTLLIGTMSGKLCAYSIEFKKQLWHIPLQDTITDVAIVNWPQEAMNKVFVGLSNGELVVIENADHNEPKDSFFKFTIGFTRITCLLIVDNLLLCGCGNSVYIFNTATLDYQGQFSISSNALDLILSMKNSKYGVWIAVRGSPLIELWDPKTRGRLMLFDTHSETYTNLREDEEGTFHVHRVTAMLPHENTVWVGTGNGDIIAFEVYDTPGYETRLRTFGFPGPTEEHPLQPKPERHVIRKDASVETDTDDLTNNVNKRRETPTVSKRKKTTRVDVLPSCIALADLAEKNGSYEHTSSTSGSGMGRARSEVYIRESQETAFSILRTTKHNSEPIILYSSSSQLDRSNEGAMSVRNSGDYGHHSEQKRVEDNEWRIHCLDSPSQSSTVQSNERVSPVSSGSDTQEPWESSKPLPVGFKLASLPTHSSESKKHTPADTAHQQLNPGTIKTVPVPSDYQPMFLPLRHDSRLLETCSDQMIRFQLHPILRNKVSETPIRLFTTNRSQSGEPHIISCATFFYDDDAVLNWYRCPTQPMIWTNQPILIYDSTSQQVQFPTYMLNTLRMRRDRSRWSTIGP